MTDSSSLHESPAVLSTATIDRHRAIASLMEELEAVDWYDQRVEACSDPELRKVLAHNRDEEKEHAAMVIEWLRRNDDAFHGFLKTYLFTDKPLVDLEARDTEGDGAAGGFSTLRIGSLKTETPR